MIYKERAKEESTSVSTTEQKPEKQPRMDFPKRSKKVSLVGDVIRRKKSDIFPRLLATPTIREESPLVLYKVLPIAKELICIKEKEPKDKYSIEYLWNIGANLRH